MEDSGRGSFFPFSPSLVSLSSPPLPRLPLLPPSLPPTIPLLVTLHRIQFSDCSYWLIRTICYGQDFVGRWCSPGFHRVSYRPSVGTRKEVLVGRRALGSS